MGSQALRQGSCVRISRKEGQRFTSCRSMVSHHAGPTVHLASGEYLHPQSDCAGEGLFMSGLRGGSVTTLRAAMAYLRW
jgi:hypothetical protein